MTPENSKASGAAWFLTGITTAGMIFFASLYYFAPKTVVQRAVSGPIDKTNAPPVAELSDTPPAKPKWDDTKPFSDADVGLKSSPAKTDIFDEVAATPLTPAQRLKAPPKTSGFNLSLLEPEPAPPPPNGFVIDSAAPKPAASKTFTFEVAQPKTPAIQEFPDETPTKTARTAGWWSDSNGIHFLTPSPATQPNVTPVLTADDLSRIEAQAQALDEARREQNDLLLKWSLEDAQLDQQWLIESDLQNLNWSVQGVKDSIDWASLQQSRSLRDLQDSIDQQRQQQFMDSIWKR
jgi:hypothetical protein